MQFLPLSMQRHASAAHASPLRGSKTSASFKPTFVAAVIAFVVAGTFFVDRAANAGVIGDIMALVLAYIFQMIAMGLGQLLLIVINALIWVYQYNGFVTAAPVANGWTIVRDVTNMFFILVLLVIAFGTILGVQNYSYKNNNALARLLIMAVVVNFSRTICGLLIDFAQVVMLTFVYGFKEAAGGNFATALSLTQMMQAREITESESASGGSGDSVTAWNIALAMLLAAIMVGIALVIVILMTITVAIRIVYLWLLVVISPLAFFLKAVPGGAASGYYAMWWKMFTSQVIVGPVMAFFLWLALVSVSSNTIASEGFPRAAGGGAGAETVSGPISQAFTDTAIESFIISICLLFGGLQLAKQISSESAGAAPGIAKKAASMAMRGGKAVARGGIGAADRVSGGRLATSGIPLVSTVAQDKRIERLQAQKKRDARAGAVAETLSPDAQRRMATGVAITDQGKAHKARAQRDLLKQAGDKPPTSEKDIADVNKWRKDLRKTAEKTGDKAILKDLGDFENKRPSLIIDKNETDSKERARQEKSFRKSAGGFNAARMGEMDASELTDQFLAFANPKAILKAQESASGDQLAALQRMGKSESEITDRQQELRARPDNFGLLSENERANLVAGMGSDQLKALAGNDAVRPEHLTGAVLDTLAQSNRAGDVADKVAIAIDYDKLRDNRDLAQQIATGISATTLGKLPDNIANELRPLVGAVDPGRALAGGASMKQAFEGFDPKSGTFADPASLAKFEGFLKADPANAGKIPKEAITANGGINDVSLSMVNNLSFKDVTNLVEKGNNDQAAAILNVAAALGAAADSKEAVAAFGASNASLTMNDSQLKAVMTKGAMLTADADKGALKDAAQWAKIEEKASRNEEKQRAAAEKLERAGERFEKKLMEKKRGRRG